MDLLPGQDEVLDAIINDDPNAVEDEFDSHIGLKPRGDE